MLYKKELLENNKSLVEENKLLKKRLEQKENIIKEVREYIKENCILSYEWKELENHNFIPIGRINYKSLSSKKVKELLEILDRK